MSIRSPYKKLCKCGRVMQSILNDMCSVCKKKAKYKYTASLRETPQETKTINAFLKSRGWDKKAWGKMPIGVNSRIKWEPAVEE